MTIAMDGNVITTVVVDSTSYSDYTYAGTIAAGNHVITVSSSNATPGSQLYLDTVSTTVGAIGDQFTGKSGSAPSSTMWTQTIGTGWDPGIQNYTSGGAYLDGKGHLVLQATRGSNGTWTSGRVETANKLSLGYGTITARIKVPKGQGLWPAFWLTGADAATNGWPQTGEIDVMELPSTTTTMYSTLHGPIDGTDATQQAQVISTLPDLSTDYHNYWVRHLENEITFGVDGQTLGTLTPADLDPGATWVYNRPMYVLLNLAVGGPWAGAPNSRTPSTAKMLVESMTFTPA
jgi:beta-glucanase (GH16 family)